MEALKCIEGKMFLSIRSSPKGISREAAAAAGEAVAAEEEAMADIMEEAGIAGRDGSAEWQSIDGIKTLCG